MNIYEVYKTLEWWRAKGGKAAVLNDTLIFNYKSDSVMLDLAYSLKNQRLTIYRMYPDDLRELLVKKSWNITEERLKELLFQIIKAVKMYEL